MQLIRINKTALFFGVMVVLLSACGGGGGGGSGATQASVSTITSQNLFMGKTGHIYINGAGLDASTQVSIEGCNTNNRLSVQSNQIIYKCFISSAEVTNEDNDSRTINITVKRADGLILKTQQFIVGLPVIIVDSLTITSAPPVYGQAELLRFTIRGQNLDAGVRLSSACPNPKTVTVAENESQYTCNVGATTDYDGTIAFKASNNAGTAAAAEDFLVPISNPMVTAFNVTSTVRYGAGRTIFNVAGTNLTPGMKLSECASSDVKSVELDKKSAVIDCEFAATKDKATFTLEVQRKDGMSLGGGSKTFTPPKPRVTITTSKGDIAVELEPSKAPITVNNFLKYVTNKFYPNLIFHRVVKSGIFINQAGGYTKGPASLNKETKGLLPPIALESTNMTGLSNIRGTIAMARTDVENSATSQFYFNVRDNSLDFDYKAAVPPATTARSGYAVFGKIIDGDSTSLATMDDINGVSTETFGTDQNVPITNIFMIDVVQTQ